MRKICLTATAFVLCIFGLLATKSSAAGNATLPTSCAEDLAPDHAIVSTLNDLYEGHVLTMQDLTAVRNGHNPFTHKHGVNQQIFDKVVDRIIEQVKQSHEIDTIFDEFIQQKAKQSRQREIKKADTAQAFVPMTMYDIPGGPFIMGTPDGATAGEDEHAHPVKVSAFRVSDIPVSQWQWATVMKNNPSKSVNGSRAIELEIDGRMVRMLPNNPVENVSWENITDEFLPIVNSWSKDDNPMIYKIIPNHLKFARIRLPTEAEFEYLVRNGGLWGGLYPDGVTEDNLHEFAWYNKNSQQSIQPIGEKRPLIIFGHPFYDLLGNVWEWVQDAYRRDYTLSCEDERLNRLTEDPVMRIGIGHVARGGCFFSDSKNLRCACRGITTKHCAYGFRLVEVPR